MQLKWRLSHIRGYIELGMLVDAAAELQQIPPAAAGQDEVLEVQVTFLQEAREWAPLAKVAGELSQRHPENPAWWVTLAYAVRRAQTLQDAEAVLLKAEQLHPTNATIQFNLGCYACQGGDLVRARTRVAQAIKLDSHFAEAAKVDPDLAALRLADLV